MHVHRVASHVLRPGDMNEALRLGDRIAVMFRGRILDCFPKSDLRKMEAVGLMMAGILPGAGEDRHGPPAVHPV